MDPKVIIITAITGFLSSCTPATNLERKPTRWVTIRDAITNKPLPHILLAYSGSANADYIVGPDEWNIAYVSDESGRVRVPDGVLLRPFDKSEYEIASVTTSPGDRKQVETYLLRRINGSNKSWRTNRREAPHALSNHLSTAPVGAH